MTGIFAWPKRSGAMAPRGGARRRRGSSPYLVVLFLVPASMFLALAALDRIDAANRDLKRAEARARARLCAESALVAAVDSDGRIAAGAEAKSGAFERGGEWRFSRKTEGRGGEERFVATGVSPAFPERNAAFVAVCEIEGRVADGAAVPESTEIRLRPAHEAERSRPR